MRRFVWRPLWGRGCRFQIRKKSRGIHAVNLVETLLLLRCQVVLESDRQTGAGHRRPQPSDCCRVTREAPRWYAAVGPDPASDWPG